MQRVLFAASAVCKIPWLEELVALDVGTRVDLSVALRVALLGDEQVASSKRHVALKASLAVAKGLIQHVLVLNVSVARWINLKASRKLSPDGGLQGRLAAVHNVVRGVPQGSLAREILYPNAIIGR